jgi:hypothetical protein
VLVGTVLDSDRVRKGSHDTPWEYPFTRQEYPGEPDRGGGGSRADPLDLPPMDPRDDHDSLAGGVDCAACGQVVPTDRVRVLAERDDIAFVEIDCAACRSESLGIVITANATDEPSATGTTEVPAAGYGEFGPRDAARFRDARPIGSADLERVHDLLARRGLDAFIDRSDSPPGSAAR